MGLFDEAMSKGVGAGGGGGVGGGGGGGGSGSFAGAAAVVAGPTVSAAAQAAQRQRSLLQRADADIGSLLDNFSHLLKAARVLISTRSSLCFSLFLSGKLQACKSQPSGFLFLASESPAVDIDSTRKQIYQRNAKPSVSKCSLLL